MSLSQKQRHDIIEEARTWLGTPWHHAARIKGVGVDCVNFIVGVYSACGLMPAITLDYYPRDWNLHRDEPRFIRGLKEYADEIDSPLKGDIVMFNFGRHAAHGAIFIEDGLIIHSYLKDGRVTISETNGNSLGGRLAGYYRLRGE